MVLRDGRRWHQNLYDEVQAKFRRTCIRRAYRDWKYTYIDLSRIVESVDSVSFKELSARTEDFVRVGGKNIKK